MSNVFEVSVTQAQEWAINGVVDFDSMPLAGDCYIMHTGAWFGEPTRRLSGDLVDNPKPWDNWDAMLRALDDGQLETILQYGGYVVEHEVWHIVKDYSIVRYRVHTEYGQTSWLTWEKANEYLEKLGLEVYKEIESDNRIEVYAS